MSKNAPDTYLVRVAAAEVLTLLAAGYVFTAVRRARPGWSRFLLAMPVFALNCYVPTLFHGWRETMTKTVFCLSHLWLSNFKVAALCFDRGSLTRSWSPIQFFAIFTAPITPRDEVTGAGRSDIRRVGSVGTLSDAGGTAIQLITRFLAKTSLLVASVYLLSAKAHTIPRLPLELLYALSLYAFLGFLMDGPASLLTSFIGLEIAPHFNQPYFSDSVASFWGKRWNLTVSNCLRAPIFDPISEGQILQSNGPESESASSSARHFLGMSACFVVSGLMHELVFWYLVGHHTPHWAWLTFFSIQAPTVAIENVVRQRMKQNNIRIPQPLRILTTIAVLLALADWFFYPPLYSSGLADHVVERIKESVNSLVA